MAKHKIKGPTTRCWCYADAKSKHKISWAQLGLAVNLPSTINNPLNFTVTVSGCPNAPTVTSWLTDGDGDKTYATISPPPPPLSVSFPPLPQGDYTLIIQVQCGSQYIKQIQGITLPAPSPPPPVSAQSKSK